MSPRLRSPPPWLALPKPNTAPPTSHKGPEPDSHPPSHSQRATATTMAQPAEPLSLSLSQPLAQPLSDTEPEESFPLSMRTPVRAAGAPGSTLETVQEVSPFASPKEMAEIEARMEDSITSEASSRETASQTDGLELPLLTRDFAGQPSSQASEGATEGAIEGGSAAKTSRRSVTMPGSAPASQLPLRQASSSAAKSGAGRGKAAEIPTQSMTVETETVTSIPQVALAPGGGSQGTNGSLRTKPSAETIRPKREKKKAPRRPPSVNAGTGEQPSNPIVLRQRLRHHRSIRSVSSVADSCASPTRHCSGHGYHDDAHGARSQSPARRSQSVFQPMNSLLTRYRPASSKADIFEAKVASAVEEANSSDSEETFVYDSNPPDRDKPARFHSRTPSATSMASQVDRAGMRSIHGVMEAMGHAPVRKNMKFVNSVNSYNSNGNDSGAGEDDGKGTGRSQAGSARGSGTTRHHHHVNRWGRNMGNGHPSLFAEDSPFSAPAVPRNLLVENPSRHSSRPTSPRIPGQRNGGNASGKRGLGGAYDLDDHSTAADDEQTPLLRQPPSIRSARSGRSRRYGATLRPLDHRQHLPHVPHARRYPSPRTLLNRFASCLVLTVMVLLVVTGAIGFMFATSQPLQSIQLVSMKNVVVSEQELMLDLTVRARNPNVVVVVVDATNIEVFAKSPHAGTDSEWWRRPQQPDSFLARRVQRQDDLSVGDGQDVPAHMADDDDESDPPQDDKAPNMRLGTITEFDSPLSFEGSFFHDGWSASTGEVRLVRPGNTTEGGSERWEHILQDEFELIIKGVLKYTLPLSQHVRSVSISGRTTIKPNSPSAEPPSVQPTPNKTEISIEPVS